MVGDPYLFLPVLSVLPGKTLLIHFPHNFLYKIMWHCYIVKECHIPTTSLLVDTISQIVIEEIWLITCVACEVSCPLIQIFLNSTSIRQYSEL